MSEDRLSIEDAKSAAKKRRKETAPHIPKSGLHIQLQEMIWEPVVRVMNVLDLLDLAWTPSWAIEGVRRVLANDDLWKFFWNRDFKTPGYCRDIPLTLPGFLTHNDETRTDVDVGDVIFLRMPWRRYYIWTYYSLRTLSKIVVHKVNEEMAVKPMYRVVDKTVASVEASTRGMGGDLYQIRVDTRIVVRDAYLRLVRDAPNDMWDDAGRWNIPVYVAKYLDLTRSHDLDIEAIFGDRDPRERLYILRWLAWCIRVSTGPQYDRPIRRGGRTVRAIIMLIGRTFEQITSAQFPPPVELPIVPRKLEEDDATGQPRNKLFLGDNICIGCGQEEATKRCARCKGALYCSKDCQVAHWHSAHKSACK